MQLRGWPVNWFLQLDPLVALGTILTTHTLYAGLLWAIATVILTIILGRFFCGWLCPFGALHHFIGYLGSLGRSTKEKIAANRSMGSQRIKYYVLLGLLSPAAGALLVDISDSSKLDPLSIGGVLCILAIAAAILRRADYAIRRPVTIFAGLVTFWAASGYFLKIDGAVSASLMTGLLDPIPLVYRSVNFLLLPYRGLILSPDFSRAEALRRHLADRGYIFCRPLFKLGNAAFLLPIHMPIRARSTGSSADTLYGGSAKKRPNAASANSAIPGAKAHATRRAASGFMSAFYV